MDHNLDDDYMLFMLNTLGQSYNYSSRFDVNNYIVADLTSTKFKDFFNDSIEQGFSIKNQKGYDIHNISKIKTNDKILFDKTFLQEKAESYIIYDTVVIKYPSNKNKLDTDKKNVILSSLTKWDNINIKDILLETSKMITDKNKVVVDFTYNKRNKYKIVNRSGSFSVILEPGISV